MIRLLSILVLTSIFLIGCKSDKHDRGSFPPIVEPGIDKQKQIGYKGLLVHMVFFSLKKDLSKKQKSDLLVELEKLKEINVVTGLSVGAFSDLKDIRALDQYDLAMTMGFRSTDDYKTYQNHPIHLRLKKEIGIYLSDPPATYDFQAVE